MIKMKKDTGKVIRIGTATYEHLKKHAELRKLTVDELIQLLLMRVE